MAFGYEFILTLDDEQKGQRRLLLNHYAVVAQLSLFTIPLLCLICVFISKVASYGLGNERPRSPSFNKQPDGTLTWLSKARQHQVQLVWWMKKDVIQNWGTRGEWLAGGIWTTWLLYLSIVDTGNGIEPCLALTNLD